MKSKIEIPENALILFVGVAGSGKSTLAKKAFGDTALIVSSDECRKEISGSEFDQYINKQAFELFYKKIDEGLKQRKQVVADATNLNKFDRENIYRIANENNAPIYAVILNIPLDIIKRQNSSRERVVPDYAIERMFQNMQKTYHEIEDEIPKGHIIDIIPSDKQINGVKQQEDR